MGDMVETLRHAKMYARYFDLCNIQSIAVAILIELNVPTKRVGFEYLKKSIILFCDDPTQTITKEIYYEVVNSLSERTHWRTVERNIRYTIDAAWENKDDRIWKIYFPISKDGEIVKPSNAEFISMIGYFIQLLNGFISEVDK